MNIDVKNNDRHLIPRWRDFNTTLKLNELSITPATNKQIDNSNFSLHEKLSDWEENRTLPFAMDLVSTALVSNEYNIATEAAQYVLSKEEKVSSLAVKQAKQILNGTSEEDNDLTELVNLNSDNLYLNSRISILKKQLYNDQYNSIAWADLSREYAIIGRPKKAQRCMEIALRIAPQNRFILRSASRLFMHVGDLARAHYILKNSHRINEDPWVMASEISTASIMGRTSHFIKQGKHLISSDNYSDLQLTELSSEIGTLEFNAGSIKNAKKLFNKSLSMPNDNSIAQAVWISRSLPILDKINNYNNVPRLYEAKALHNVDESKWDEALSETISWLNDLPFSSRPAILGTYLASTTLENYELGERIARFGLIANPKDSTISNNLAFALIQQGKLEEAEKVFASIKLPEDNNNEIITNYATAGLIMFRKNNFEAGRYLYNKAISHASKTESPVYRAIASVYLAFEEIRFKTEYVHDAFKSASKYSKDLEDPYVKLLFKRLLRLYSKEYNITKLDDFVDILRIEV